MTPTGPVHFIYLGGPFVWQHRRAVETAARVHGSEVIVWHATPWGEAWGSEDFQALFPDEDSSERTGIWLRSLDLPDWLRDHPIQLANVKDLYAWRILHEHGGLYLDLDTISLKPVWDLLGRADVLASCEWDDGFKVGPKYNSAVVCSRAGSPMLADLAVRAERLLRLPTTRRWGALGPWLLTEVAPEYGDKFKAAPMPLLNGWRDDTIHRYYQGEWPDPRTRVVHLYSSSNQHAFLADRWMP